MKKLKPSIMKMFQPVLVKYGNNHKKHLMNNISGTIRYKIA